MTTPEVAVFDRTAPAYQRWWAPILQPGADALAQLLARRDPGLKSGERREVLDVGCGTGNVAFTAVRLWPGARVTGLDGSTGMLAVAAQRQRDLPPGEVARVTWACSDVAQLPFPEGIFDIVTCAFVLQQVADRPAVMGEMRRVLRPGGLLGIVGWLTEDEPFAPDVELEAALADTGIVRPPRRHSREGHYPSVESAARELAGAGFRAVEARPDRIQHVWAARDFVVYRRTTRDQDIFESLTPDVRERLEANLNRRLAKLEPEQWVYKPPVVLIAGRRV